MAKLLDWRRARATDQLGLNAHNHSVNAVGGKVPCIWYVQ
jgi:hypothetical protein